MAIDAQMNRRLFLGLAAAAALAPGRLPAAARMTPGAFPGGFFAGCGKDRAGGYVAAAFDGAGSSLFEAPLPERGHDIAVHPAGKELVVFERRPGIGMHILEAESGRTIRRIEASKDRHFYGHGVFSHDGRTLYVTENDFSTGRGMLGIYDVAGGYSRVGETPTGGIGPHQLRLLPDGRTLAVANGGILTHPDRGRDKLNIADMKPSLVFIDPATGKTGNPIVLSAALHQLSIRHIDVAASGSIAVAMQYEGDRRDHVPLVALAVPHGEVRFLSCGKLDPQLRHYTASICFDRTGSALAVTSPRGNLVIFWNVGTGQRIGHATVADASGVAPGNKDGTFMVTGGDGSILHIDAVGGTRKFIRPPDGGYSWDNHLTAG